jgi:NitT/TauT family transport system substrate-binding protein
MSPVCLLRAFILGAALAASALMPARAQGTLDKVSFGTNWVAEAEHGGFFQAVADGTYKKYGLDVTIVPGGPNVNNRILLISGKLDFFMSANTLQSTCPSSRWPRCSRRIRRCSSRIPIPG